MNIMQPSASLLCKLGSIAVHAEELLSPTTYLWSDTEAPSKAKHRRIKAGTQGGKGSAWAVVTQEPQE